MYKVENINIAFGLNKGKNRLLDNYLDWVLYSILPKSVADLLFPRFVSSELGASLYAMQKVYLDSKAQTITDSDTTMTYEVYSQASTDGATEILSSSGKTININYEPFVFGSIPEELTLKSLGFGRNDFYTTDFLLSFINIAPTQTVYDGLIDYGVTRVDQITTNETAIVGDMGYLPGITSGRLESISMCYATNGGNPVREYHFSELTFTYTSAGKVAVTGFDDFYIEDNILYPATDLYPSTSLYPTQSGEKIRSVKFRYKGNDDSATKYETYINIEDLDISYNGTDVSLNLVCERG